MKRMFGIVAATALVGTAWAQEPEPDVMEVLRNADQATREVQRVQYDFELTGTGFVAESMSPASGWVKLQKVEGEGQHPMAVHVEIKAEGAQPQVFDLASDGKKAYRIDHGAKKFQHGDLATGGDELLREASLGSMIEFVHPTPFMDELTGDSAKWEGVQDVGGVECDVVYVVYEGGQLESRWFYGKEDHLPRRVERIFKSDDADGARILTLTNLKADPDFTGSTFTLTAPEGFASEEYKRKPLMAVGDEAPDWELKNPEGEVVHLSDLRGNIVVMDFWATWCGPCKRAMPGMQALHEHFEGKPVKILGINTWEEDPKDAAEYMSENALTYGLLVEGDKVAAEYGVRGIPTFYVIGPDGKVLHVAVGFSPDGEEQLKKLIEAELAKAKG